MLRLPLVVTIGPLNPDSTTTTLSLCAGPAYAQDVAVGQKKEPATVSIAIDIEQPYEPQASDLPLIASGETQCAPCRRVHSDCSMFSPR